jgi:hypothetical protein
LWILLISFFSKLRTFVVLLLFHVCFRYSKQILEQLGESCTLIIAADPVAMTRSSDAIGAFRKRGSLKGFTPAAWPIVTKSFSDERITERMRQDPGQTTYPSVTEAVQKAITIIHDSHHK